MSRRRVCVVVGSRANYSSIKSVMRAIATHSALDLQVICAASALLDRYGSVVNLIRADGFEPAAELHMLIEGETPTTMAMSTGLGLMSLPAVFDRLRPEFVVTVGDRFETMATTLAAAYMNIAVAHTMGGEVSGTIDESIRHAVTKFAHVHFPASRAAAERIIRLGERPEDVHVVGCPRIDLVAEILEQGEDPRLCEILFREGVGNRFDLNRPFVLCSQHPVTTEFGAGEGQIIETLEAVESLDVPAVVLWPNADAGADEIARGIRKWREQGRGTQMHFFKNLPIDVYVRLMHKTACVVGNSSSAIREGAFIGTPAVNVGSRQNMRERGSNVIDVPNDRDAIRRAIAAQIAHGPYPMEPLYGDGQAGKRVADILAVKHVAIQKRIAY